jgi:hypothetical protein
LVVAILATMGERVAIVKPRRSNLLTRAARLFAMASHAQTIAAIWKTTYG